MFFTNCEEQNLSNNINSESIIAGDDNLSDSVPVDYITIDELEKLFPGLIINQSITRSICDQDEVCFAQCCSSINEHADLNGDGLVSAADLAFAGPWFAAGGAGSWDGVNYVVQTGDPQWIFDFAEMSYFVTGEGGGVVTYHDFLIIMRYLANCYECF